MTRHRRTQAFRRASAVVASAALILAGASVPAQAAEQASQSTTAASATPQPRMHEERTIVGWAGLTQDAPLAGGRVRILTAFGLDITERVTGFSPTAPCKGDAAAMCTQKYGVIHVPLIAKVPAGSVIVVSGGSILGKKMRGSFRARMDVERGVVRHPTVTLGSTVLLALEKAGMGTQQAHQRTLAALGLHRAYSLGFSERHDSPLLDKPGVVDAVARVGVAKAVGATVRSVLRHPGKKAPWLARAEKATVSTNARDFEWTSTGVAKWTAGQLAGGIVGAIGGQAFSLFLGAVGYNPEQARLLKLQKALEAEMEQGFDSVRQEMNTGFQTISNLVNTQGSAAACQDAKNLVSTGVGQIVSGLAASEYQEAWNAYATAVLDETLSQATVEALFSQMSGWSPTGGSQIGLKAYQNAFSPVNGVVSSTSIAAAWQQDLQCLRGSTSDATISPLITAKSWPTTDTASPVVPVSVQLGTYYTGVAARGALLDSVFAAFVQTCGTRPTVDGACPAGSQGASTITTNDTWAKVYKPGCAISPSQQVGCAGVNYYATLAGSLIEPVGDGLALDYRTGNWWSVAGVNVDDLYQEGTGWNFDVSQQACEWRTLMGWSDCPTDFALPTRAQMDALVATQTTVRPLGSTVSINLVGMPSAVNPASSTTTYADVLNSWYSYFPSAAMAANPACGPNRGTGFTDTGVQRGAPQLGVLMGFSGPSAGGATCTGSVGALIPETILEIACPVAFGAGDYTGPKWNIHGDGNESDLYYTRDDYKGNSLAMGFGYPQPGSGSSCAGWAYVDPPSLSNWWALLPTGDPANVAATPITLPAIQQYLLDGTSTASSPGSWRGVAEYPHDPSDYGDWQVNPVGGYYSAVRYVGFPQYSAFRGDINANAVALWGNGVPLGFDVGMGSLVVRNGGWQPFLYEDSSSSANQTLCPQWDLGQGACGGDGHFVAVMPGEFALNLTTIGTSGAQTTATATAAAAVPAVARRARLVGRLSA